MITTDTDRVGHRIVAIDTTTATVVTHDPFDTTIRTYRGTDADGHGRTYTPGVTYARTTYTARDRRRVARSHRRNARTYRTGMHPVTRALGWVALCAFVALASGMGSAIVGGHLDTIHNDAPTGTYDTYRVPGADYVRTPICPTEDSCRRVFDGTRYNWLPVVP